MAWAVFRSTLSIRKLPLYDRIFMTRREVALQGLSRIQEARTCLGWRNAGKLCCCLRHLCTIESKPTMTASTMVDRRQGRRRPRPFPIISHSNALAILTVCALGSIHSPATADPMIPSAHLKHNHLARSASNKPFKKTHAERMAYRTRQWKEYHSESYSGAPPADYGGEHPFEVMAAAEAGAHKEQQRSAK